MRRARKLWARSPAERRLLAHALLLHAGVIVALRLIRFGRLRAWGSALYRRRRAWAVDEAHIVWAARTAAALTPIGRTCLSEALTAHWLMAAGGHESAVQFGVAHDAARRVVAHAWLESASLVDGAAGHARLCHPGGRL